MDQYRTSLGFPTLTPAVGKLLLVNGVVFFLNMILAPATGDGITRWCGVSWNGLFDGFGLGLYRLVTYQFVHSFVDPWHLLFNMMVLYFFGTMVESAIGGTRLVRLYLVAGVCGGILQAVLELVGGNPQRTTIGASGACYGILVFAAMMRPQATVMLLVFPIRLWVLAAFLVGIGLYSMYVELVANASSGVAHGGHVGGALWGFLSYRIAHSGWRWAGRWKRWRHERRFRAEQNQQQVMDRILEKVHREGLSSLTPAERRFLQKASQSMQRR